MHLVYLIIVGAVAGWLAGQIMKGKGFGLVWNVILGIVGSMVGGWIDNNSNPGSGFGFVYSQLVEINFSNRFIAP